jgi:hypothetical protein
VTPDDNDQVTPSSSRKVIEPTRIQTMSLLAIQEPDAACARHAANSMHWQSVNLLGKPLAKARSDGKEQFVVFTAMQGIVQ